ncbi:MAG: class I SAM-dependent methyltransferase [Erythrobacter sp.]|uniref:class I SAM-dependent methyltransferase n=1 Tax=Erythrobacter sp. TaxID=1042 RepID=UPI003A852A6B
MLAWHPEKAIDGFSSVDGTVMFFNFVRSCCLKTNASDVLDYGAGRGMFWYEDPSEYRRALRDLRSTGATVTACDIDEAVLSHPCSHKQVKIEPLKPLPFADASFDVVVSENTFEHIEDSQFVADELYRILKPGGYICARTPNRAGYLRLLAEMVPNPLHAKVLETVQPERKAEDVFPTVYKMNSPRQIKRLFPKAEVVSSYTMGEPSYFFGNRLVYAGFKALHWLLPSRLSPAISFFIHKPDESPPGP